MFNFLNSLRSLGGPRGPLRQLRSLLISNFLKVLGDVLGAPKGQLKNQMIVDYVEIP